MMMPSANLGPDWYEMDRYMNEDRHMNQNRELWDRVCKTDPAQVKPITGKQYKGNSPKPYYIVERLTEEFGPCGIGWGLRIVSQQMERLSETDVLHVAHVRFWYVRGSERGEIEQIGQTKAVYEKSAGGLMVDEDAPKKSVTDALVKCASYLGFAGDIFSGRWDDSKYVAALRTEFSNDIIMPDNERNSKPGYTAHDVCVDGMNRLDEEAQAHIRQSASKVTKLCQDELVGLAVDYIKLQKYEQDEMLGLWSLLDSKVRSAIKVEEKKRREAKTQSS